MRDLVTKTILVGTVLLTNILAGTLGGYWLYESRDQYEKRAEALTQNLAFGLDQNVTSIIDKIDLILQTTAEELERRNQGENARRSAAGASDNIDPSLIHFIDSHAAHLAELAAIGVADESGKLILATGSSRFGHSDFKDEPYFKGLRDHPDSGLFVSAPLENQIEAKRVLIFARPVHRYDGRLAGIVLAALPTDYLVQLMAHYAVGRQEALALRDTENRIIARFPVAAAGQPGAIGSSASSDELRRAILAGQQEGTTHSSRTADGVPRTFSLRRLDIFPLYVVAGVPEDEYLEDWHMEVKRTVIFLSALLMVTSVSAGFIYRLIKLADEQSRRNRMFLERASDGVYVLDSKGILIEASDSFCAMLGYQREELIGCHISTWEARRSKSELDEIIQRNQLVPEHSATEDSLHRRKDGSLLAVEIHSANVTSGTERFIYGSSRDITERNRLKAEIDAALGRFEAIFENNPVPLGMIDVRSGLYIDVNPAWVALSGHSRDKVVGSDGSEIGMWVDPEDRKRFFQAIGPDGRVGPWEGQFYAADGRMAYCSVKGQMVSLGSQQLFIWAVEDITERKEIEVGLRLAASVFDFSHDGIIVTDMGGKIVEVNPSFSRITGYQRHEAIGQESRLLVAHISDGEQSEAIWEEIWQRIAETGGWRGEISNRRKSGDVYPALLSIAAIQDDQGQVQRYIWVFSDISQIKEHQAELHRVAHYDALTGLPNRRLLADRLHQAIARSHRQDSVLAVCFLDLDGFKEVNDQLGHDVGDRVLIAVSHQIQGVLRGEDTLARLGGDEFVILLNDTGSDEVCFQVLDRVLAAIATATIEIDSSISLSGSIGVTLFPRDESDADVLLRHADQAMYRAKESGKNRYHKFDPEHDRAVRASQEALHRLALAIEREELVLHYQPKVNLVTGKVIGSEALVRWLHPERGVMGPSIFLPGIENTELEITLGDYVFEAALTQLERWKEQGLTLPLSVNVSPHHLQMAHFSERLQAILARHPRVEPGDLQLEIIESNAIGDIKRASATLETCRAMGVSFALDDFGTGYSSLTYFRTLPIDMLKIDQSFVRDMLDHPDDLGLVESVVHLAQAFKRPVIAEGVETEQHGALLVKLGCHLGQGFGIARPMPADLLADWITEWEGGAGWRFSA